MAFLDSNELTCTFICNFYAVTTIKACTVSGVIFMHCGFHDINISVVHIPMKSVQLSGQYWVW